MDPETFWKQYVGDASPGEFMTRFRSRNPARCVQRYIDDVGTVYGVVRLRSWRETFAQETQHTRDAVATALLTHLEETRDEWEQALREQHAIGGNGHDRDDPSAPVKAKEETESAEATPETVTGGPSEEGASASGESAEATPETATGGPSEEGASAAAESAAGEEAGEGTQEAVAPPEPVTVSPPEQDVAASPESEAAAETETADQSSS